MTFYWFFLTAMCVLFAASAVVLLFMAVVQWARGRGRRAAAYFGLTILAGVVSAGFYLVRRLV